ncbi:hypothetical protein RRG08_003772 [Elysia crispata]|uniref:EF-hand domain-containing protein n=1 Tax=Elysia crispata TaxID=231223 RepID=A0AAE1E562_9GAST|nr:hypothetical protein RRG08_003772 [Elysia crispata]
MQSIINKKEHLKGMIVLDFEHFLTDGMTFEDFVEICRREPVTSEDDLMKAFRKIDLNGDGYISLDELFKIMTTKGEKMSRAEVKEMIDEVDENKDGRLDYREFAKMVVSTTEDFKRMSLKEMERKEKRKMKRRDGDITPRKDKDEQLSLGSQLSVRSSASDNKKSRRRKTSSSSSSRRQNQESYVEQGSRRNSRVSRRHGPDDNDGEEVQQGMSRSASRQSLLSNVSQHHGNAAPLFCTSEHCYASVEECLADPKMAEITALRSSQQSLRSSRPEDAQQGIYRSVSRQSLISNASYDELTRPSPRGRRESRPKSAGKGGRNSEPPNLREWSALSSKGAFFLDEDGSVISHVFSLTLTEDSDVWITIQPLKIGEAGESLDGTVIDTALLVLSEDDNSFMAFTENKDTRGRYNLRCSLSQGSYLLVPFTTGCRLRPRRDVSVKEAKLISKDKDGKINITRAFRKALEEIFDMADLDGNGLLSRDEFNWFNQRTSGEDIADDEWQVVEDNIELERGEITRAGFIKLNEMEADDNEGDTDDLWITLTGMGFNKSLIIDEACPFVLKVHTQDCYDPELRVITLKNSKDKINAALCDFVISKGEPNKVRGMKDLILYQYTNDHRAIIVLDNKSKSRVKVELDCSKRRNLVSHTGSLVSVITVPGQTSVVGHNILPLDDRAEFSVICEENIMK